MLSTRCVGRVGLSLSFSDWAADGNEESRINRGIGSCRHALESERRQRLTR